MKVRFSNITAMLSTRTDISYKYRNTVYPHYHPEYADI